MNVRELILELADLPPDMEILISKDSEGNLINRIASVQVEDLDVYNDVVDTPDATTRQVVVIWP